MTEPICGRHFAQLFILQKKLREQLSTPASGAAPEAAYPLAPIGHLQSCFSQRNGTPRQPLLARNARAKLVLRYSSTPRCKKCGVKSTQASVSFERLHGNVSTRKSAGFR
jgi:hypothetical protein